MHNYSLSINLGNQISSIAHVSFNPESSILNPISHKVSDINENCNETYNSMLSVVEIFKANVELIKEKIKKLDSDSTEERLRHVEDTKQQYEQLSSVISK